MADTTDLVSAIGTWLGVGLGVLALISVVAPVLVWWATRSEQNRALNALAEGGAEAFGYVSHGLWAGRQTRVFRRVRAPVLCGQPVLRAGAPVDVVLRFGTGVGSGSGASDGSQQPPQSSAGWVQFGSVVEAYGIEVARGDALVVEEGCAWMPVHTSWLLLVGLLGRFGKWRDKGRFPLAIPRGTTSTQASVRAPGMVASKERDRYRRGVPGRYQDGSTSPWGWEKSTLPWEDFDDRRVVDGLTHRPLYGLTGIMYTARSSRRHHSPNQQRTKPKVFFSRHENNRSGDLAEETISVGWLFWMAVGCIPAAGHLVVCLADVQDRPVMPGAPLDVASGWQSPATRPRVRFEAPETSDSDSDSLGPEIMPPPGPVRMPPTGLSPVVYVPQEAGGPATTGSFDPSRPRAFRLSPCDDRLDTQWNFAAIVHAESPGTQVVSLQEIALEEDEAYDLAWGDGGTYVARSSDWLRLEYGETPHTLYGPKFLRRRDGQVMAAALLNLPLSPYGYLMSFDRSLCRSMLCESAQSIRQLLSRIMWDADHSFNDLENDDRENLKTALAVFQSVIEPVKRTRTYFDALYRLDKALEAATGQEPPSKQVALSPGCVMITSPEFRSLVAQSARLLAEGFDGTMCVDLGAGLVKVATVMNFLAEFPVDVDDIFPGVGRADRSGVFDVPLARVVLVCLRAALRSAMLDSALDSRPLFHAVSGLGPEQTVYMG